MSDYINKGLAALGLDEGGDDRRERSGRRRDYSDEEEDDYDEEYSDESPRRHGESRRGRDSRDVGRYISLNERTSSIPGAEGEEGSRRTGSVSDDSDLGSSSDEKGKKKKLRRDTLLASGLATAATIHAAHSVYSGVEKRRKRVKMVQDGEITPEEFRKRRLKSNLTDAASVGIAALSIKSALSEWKEVGEKRKETSSFQKECEERAIKRDRHRRARSHGAMPSTRLPDEIEYPDGRRMSQRRYYDDISYGLQSPSPEPQRISY